MDKEIQTLHELTKENAEQLWHYNEQTFFYKLRQSIHEYSLMGETWDLPTLQFYFYQHNPESVPF